MYSCVRVCVCMRVVFVWCVYSICAYMSGYVRVNKCTVACVYVHVHMRVCVHERVYVCNWCVHVCVDVIKDSLQLLGRALASPWPAGRWPHIMDLNTFDEM